MKNPIYLGLNEFGKIYYRIITFINIKHVPIIMDIGCGTRPQTIIVPDIHCCIDPYKPYLDKIENTNDRIWLKNVGDWTSAIEIMEKGVINSVFLLDIIEHIDKNDAKKLLQRTEQLVKDQIIVYTPFGYFEQKESPDGKDAWGMDGAEFQKHKSGWYPDDFGDGWTVWIIPYAHIVDSLNQPIKPSNAILAIYNKR